jgi:hypothetical protein
MYFEGSLRKKSGCDGAVWARMVGVIPMPNAARGPANSSDLRFITCTSLCGGKAIISRKNAQEYGKIKNGELATFHEAFTIYTSPEGGESRRKQSERRITEGT